MGLGFRVCFRVLGFNGGSGFRVWGIQGFIRV